MQRLHELGIVLPAVAQPKGEYVPAVQSGLLVICSGQTPVRDGVALFVGRVGAEVTAEQGKQAARQAGLNCLAAICSLIGSIDRIVRVLNLRGYVNSAPDFYAQPAVVNGASELMVQIFGDAGRHSRCALGVAGLPGNVPVEVELMVEVRN